MKENWTYRRSDIYMQNSKETKIWNATLLIINRDFCGTVP